MNNCKSLYTDPDGKVFDCHRPVNHTGAHAHYFPNGTIFVWSGTLMTQSRNEFRKSEEARG